MENKVKCPTCDGTGEVHSHNPICWTCRGNGETTLERAGRAQRIEQSQTPRRTWDYE